MVMKVKGRGHDPYWKLVEMAVAFVEMGLDPEARVEHDAKLWERKAKEWVQCDVVIRRGLPFRETVTLVEVQARKAKVDRKTFDAWCVKRDNVQAQHLICVSEKGFERPVIQSAREQGNAVKLVTFSEIPIDDLPVKFKDGQLQVVVPKITVLGMSVKTEDNKLPGDTFKRRDVEFSLNGKPTSIDELFRPFTQPVSPPMNGEAIHTRRLDFDSDEVVMMSWLNDTARVLSLTTEYRVTADPVTLTINSRAYLQLEYDGVLAWYASGSGMLNGEPATMHLVMTQKDDGNIDMATIVTDAFGNIPINSISFLINPAGSE